MRKGRLSLIAIALAVAVSVALIVATNMLSTRPSITVVAVVEGKMYRSEQPAGQDWARIQRAIGLKTVINLRDPEEHDERLADELHELERLGIGHVNIPIRKLHPTPNELELFLKTVTDPANQPVLIHCEVGRARTGLMVALYRIRVQGWPAEQALEEMAVYYTGVIPGSVRRYLRAASGEVPATGRDDGVVPQRSP